MLSVSGQRSAAELYENDVSPISIAETRDDKAFSMTGPASIVMPLYWQWLRRIGQI